MLTCWMFDLACTTFLTQELYDHTTILTFPGWCNGGKVFFVYVELIEFVLYTDRLHLCLLIWCNTDSKYECIGLADHLRKSFVTKAWCSPATHSHKTSHKLVCIHDLSEYKAFGSITLLLIIMEHHMPAWMLLHILLKVNSCVLCQWSIVKHNAWCYLPEVPIPAQL